VVSTAAGGAGQVDVAIGRRKQEHIMSRFALATDGTCRRAISLICALVLAGCAGGTASTSAVAPSEASTASPTVIVSSTVVGSSAPSASPAASDSLALAGPTPAACPGAPAAAAPGTTQVPDPAAPAGTILGTIPTADDVVTAVMVDGSVWVGSHGHPAVYRIDPATIVATRIDVDLDHRFDTGGPIVPGLGGPWYGPLLTGTNVRAWTHVDSATSTASTPATLQLALSKLGANGATGLAETTDGVWGAASDVGAIDVAEFDRHDGHELRRIAIAGPAEPGRGPRFLVSAFGSLWETGNGDKVLERIDPSTGTLIGAIALPVTPVGMVVGDKALYLSTADASVTRVDPTTDCVTALRFLGGAATDPATGGGDLIAAASGADAVYVAYDRGGLAVLDPTTLAVRKAFRVDTQDFQGGLTTTDGTVWYPTFDNGTILRVRP
jgi:streptogramin lyase